MRPPERGNQERAMERRRFLQCGGGLAAGLFLTATGCRGTQKAHVLSEKDKDMVGSHTAGAETWEPLIEQSVGQLLGRQTHVVQTAGGELVPGRKRICFVGV